MKIRLSLFVGILFGFGGLFVGYTLAGLVLPARLLLGVGVAWCIAGWRRWTWFGAIGLLTAVAAAGYGLWSGQPVGWLLSGAAGALVAWDAGEFSEQLRAAPRHVKVDTSLMERSRLARYGLLVFLGALLGSIFAFLRGDASAAWLVYAGVSGLPSMVAVLVWWPRTPAH
jgi:hypothetical protein